MTESLSMDFLDSDDLAALRELANLLWSGRRSLAAEWSQRLAHHYAATYPGENIDARSDALIQSNEEFLSLVLDRMRAGDLSSFYQTFYHDIRRRIDTNFSHGSTDRLSMYELQDSARVLLTTLADRVDSERLLLAFAKLDNHLLALVAKAYGDCAEERLNRTFKRTNDFAHDVRSPLSRIVGYLDLLREGEFGPITPEQQSTLARLGQETGDVLWMFTEMLELSRMEAGRVIVRKEEFDIVPLCRDLAQAAAAPDNTPITCTAPESLPHVCSDRVQVKHVLTCLLRTVTHAAPAAPVFVTVENKTPGSVTVAVGSSPPDASTGDADAGQDPDRSGEPEEIGVEVARRLARLLGGTLELARSSSADRYFRFTVPGVPDSAAPSDD